MNRPTPQSAALAILRSRYADASVVFLSGSVVRNEATPSSDLDLVVIHESIPRAYRESFMHDSWPVEAFVHDPSTLEYFFADVDRPTGIPSLANMVAEGIALPNESAFSETMKRLARKSLEQGPPIWSEKEIDASRYAITSLLDDLRTPRSRDELSASACRLYELAATHFFRSRQLWAANDKSIPRRFTQIAPEFGRRFSETFRAIFEHGNSAAACDLCDEILSKNGGRLFSGYRLDAPATWRVS